MSEFTSPSAEPNYIARLALQSAPFNVSVEPNIFFKCEQIEQRYNLLLHLIRASDKVGILVAEQGLGKSTLLTQLQRNTTDDLRICRINGDASLTSMDIIMQCLSAFGVDDNDVKFSNDHLILLRDRLSGLRQLNIKPLLLIDDIDLVSEEPLIVLMDCLSWQSNDEFLLHAVFTSKKLLPALENIHGRLQQIDLPALSEQEVPSYLDYRLKVVGYKGESVFNLKDLKQCYRQSSGIPALVNQWAHQHLLGMKSTVANPIKINMNFNVGRFIPLLRWLGLGLLVSTLIVLLLFQDTINDLFAPKMVEEMIIEKPFTKQEESLATVILDEDKVTSAAQAERDELKSLVSELAEVVVEPEKVSDAISQDEVNPKAQAIVTQPISVAKPQLVPKPVLKAELPPAIHQKKWILQQSATDYTFQLMGSWEKQEVVAFLEKYALAGDVAEFESMRNGRVWYSLIYGVYDNKQAALEASSKWPAPINTLPSWLRRFDSVQQQIKKTAN
jgi:DamX protein